MRWHEAEKLTAITHTGKESTAHQGLETGQVAISMNEMISTGHDVASNASCAADASGTVDQEAHASKEVVNDNNMQSICLRSCP